MSQTYKEFFRDYDTKSIQGTKFDKIITKESSWHQSTIYGNTVIGCNTFGVHSWKLKIHRISEHGCVIGIDEGNHQWINKRFYTQISNHYAFNSKGTKYDINGNINNNGIGFKSGDTIYIKLDMNKKLLTLSLKDNECQHNYSSFNINPTINGYSLAISLFWRFDCIQLLSYDYHKSKRSNKIKQKTAIKLHEPYTKQEISTFQVENTPSFFVYINSIGFIHKKTQSMIMRI